MPRFAAVARTGSSTFWAKGSGATAKHPSPDQDGRSARSQSTLHAIEFATLTEAGDHTARVPVLCVITRFRLRTPLDLLFTYLDYRRVLKQVHAAHIPGFLRSAFLIENLKTCFSVSFWSDRRSIGLFGSEVPFHVRAARNVLPRILAGHTGAPELWSTKWQLASVSNNLSWKDWDLRSLIVDLDRKAEDHRRDAHND
ncbi:MAG: hypothetical protein ACREJ4_17430 [Candidatus Methylomirabilaceae bacterium]